LVWQDENSSEEIKMIRCTLIGLAMAMLVLTAGCMPGDTAIETGAGTESTQIAIPKVAVGLPPASVLISHRVADYDAWKTVFDDHNQSRKDASCLGHYLKRGMDDPSVVYVFCLATNADRLRTFLESDDLADAMRNAGVEGAPTITLMKPMSRDLVSGQRLPGIIIMHPVKDYDAWRVAYDDSDEFRRKNGIVGHAVSQEFENSNNIVAYHQANDVASLRNFVESMELKDVMQRAGVVGDPEIRFIEVVDFANYQGFPGLQRDD